MGTKDKINELHKALEDSSFTVAITGAGISFSAGGANFAALKSRPRSSAQDMMSGDPDSMYQAFYRLFLNSMFEHGPSLSHRALASLEASGKLQGIITTNGDCLHTMAGSKNVAEIQGSFQVNVCTDCHLRTYGYEIWSHGKMPSCEHCGGMLVPFSTYSHAGLLESEVDKAQDWLSRADLILIIGAHGSYASTYWRFRNRNAKVVQINPKKTKFDKDTDLTIRAESDFVFQALMDME